MDVWINADDFAPFSKRLVIIKQAAQALMDGKADSTEKTFASNLLTFIKHMEKLKRLLTSFQSVKEKTGLEIRLQPFHIPVLDVTMENFVPGAEHLYIAKQIFGVKGLYSRYNNPDDVTLTIYRKDDSSQPNLRICDGCNVRPPHRHACHKGEMHIAGEKRDTHCECVYCTEIAILHSLGAIMRPYQFDIISFVSKWEKE